MKKDRSNKVAIRCKGCEYALETKAHDGYKYARCQHYGKPVWDVKKCSIKEEEK